MRLHHDLSCCLRILLPKHLHGIYCNACSAYLYRLTKNENAVEASHVTTQGNFQPSNNAQFVCPITGQELNGRFRFSVLRNTGDVVSERAIKQVYVVLFVVQVSRGNWWFVSTECMAAYRPYGMLCRSKCVQVSELDFREPPACVCHI